jgi:AcrR family transcriptional regulator
MPRKRPVRTPKQKRSLETLRRIAEAGEKLFSEKGFHGTNSKEIAAAAGVSIGAFYDYFPDKKALFMDVSRRYTLRVMDRIFPKGPPAEAGEARPHDVVLGIIRAALDAHDLSPQFHREATAMRYSDPDIQSLMDEEEKEILARLRETLRATGEKVRVRDLEAGIIVMKSAIEEVIHGIKIFTPPVSEERLLRELADMVSRYLFDVP